MTRRERFEATMKHTSTDRVPMDFCGTSLTAFDDDSTLLGMGKILNISSDNKDELLEKVQKSLNVDFRKVGTIFNPESSLTSFGENGNTDCWGVKRQWSGIYWEITGHPLTNATIEDLDSFPWPQVSKIDKKLIKSVVEKAKRLYYDTDYVVVGEHPTYGIMELGCWMCGFDDFLYRLLGEPEFVEKFFSKVYTYQTDLIELYYEAIGDFIHLTTSGDDFGTQRGPFLSPDTFKEMIAPWYKKRIELTKTYTNAYFFHHSCGSIYRLLNSIIDMGVDIINPVQPGAFEMEPAELKKEFGDKIVFWGAIDEQNTLTNGTEQDVRRHVEEVL